MTDCSLMFDYSHLQTTADVILDLSRRREANRHVALGGKNRIMIAKVLAEKINLYISKSGTDSEKVSSHWLRHEYK